MCITFAEAWCWLHDFVPSKLDFLAVQKSHGERHSGQKGFCALCFSNQCGICHPGKRHTFDVSNSQTHSLLFSGLTWKDGCYSDVTALLSPLQLANRYWAPHSKNKLPFDPKVSFLPSYNFDEHSLVLPGSISKHCDFHQLRSWKMFTWKRFSSPSRWFKSSREHGTKKAVFSRAI